MTNVKHRMIPQPNPTQHVKLMRFPQQVRSKSETSLEDRMINDIKAYRYSANYGNDYAVAY